MENSEIFSQLSHRVIVPPNLGLEHPLYYQLFVEILVSALKAWSLERRRRVL